MDLQSPCLAQAVSQLIVIASSPLCGLGLKSEGSCPSHNWKMTLVLLVNVSWIGKVQFAITGKGFRRLTTNLIVVLINNFLFCNRNPMYITEYDNI